MTSPEAWREAGEMVCWRGHRIFVRYGGSGPPLVLLHGVPGGGWVWHRVWQALARHFTVIAPDLIGFGFSDKPPRFRYDLEAYADLCGDLMTNAGHDRARVLAHDHGDAVAAELLARGRVSGAVFLNGGVVPGADRPTPMLRWMTGPAGRPFTRLLLRRPFRRRMAALAGPTVPLSEAELDALWTLTVQGGGRRVMPRLMTYRADRLARRDRLEAALTTARVPLHLLVGLADPLDAAGVVRAWRALLPEAPARALPDIGHFPQLQAPARVVETVTAMAVRG